ncbi:hypothetical protein ABT009_30890 [Streptomyces sp. NPDC002896]|uniref:hypothetical protein n=1 Tax=Streptomyces sp. NPDC002896 TaxID=3154438 RepID=UPI003328E982
MHDSTLRLSGRRLRGLFAQPNVVFGGVYGAVLASSLAAALTEYGETSRADRLYDSAWLLFTACASALAHGYAHIIARRGERPARLSARAALRVLAEEWPLVVATLPTVLMLFGAGQGWWESKEIEYIAFGFNILLLFTWGLFTMRAAGRTWRSSLVIACVDALLGVIVVIANALIH